MNYSDSARIKAVLSNSWMAYVDNKEQADIVILDTCSVRQKSEDKVWGQLKELRSDQKIWLTWCMIGHNLNLKKTGTTKSKKMTMGNFVDSVSSSEPMIVWLESLQEDSALQKVVKAFKTWKSDAPDNILYVNHAFDPLFRKMNAQFPNVELFFRINDLWLLPYALKKLWYEVNPHVDIVNEYTGIIPHNANMLFKENTKTAYVPISTWCSQFCAYCIVPYARGLEKNRPIDEIMTEVQAHVRDGAEEIVLLGQIVNKHPDFYQILKQTAETPWVRWVRYTSPYPTYYSQEIWDLHESMENICPHVHMPLQSGSDAVLKKMFRGYTTDQYRQFVDEIRSIKRKMSITTDIIVGFCDETEEDFVESLELTRYSKFDMIYIGIYSPRPWTYGARKYEDNVPTDVKKERRARLNDVLTDISAQNNQAEIGQTRLMMIKSVSPWSIAWYTDNMKNIVVTVPEDHTYTVWSFVTATITDVKPFTLYGHVVV